MVDIVYEGHCCSYEYGQKDKIKKNSEKGWKWHIINFITAFTQESEKKKKLSNAIKTLTTN